MIREFLFVLFLFLVAENLTAQKRFAQIIYKNGDTLTAKVKISNDFKFAGKTYVQEKFKIINNDGTKEEIDWNQIEHINTKQLVPEIKTVKYKQFKIKGKDKMLIFEEIVGGKVSLYRKVYVFTTIVAFGKSTEKLYLHREGEDELLGIQETPFFRKNYKGGIKLYFNDCPELIEKVDKNKFRLRRLNEIVKFYNENCN